MLVITDVLSKFSQAFVTPDQKADTTAKVILKEWFLKYGVSECLHSDQGRNFESAVIAELCHFKSSAAVGCVRLWGIVGHHRVPRQS